MEVGFEAKDSISKEAQNPKCGKLHSTFLEWRAFLYNWNRGHWIILVILTTRLTHHKSSGGRIHCYFSKMVCSADLLAYSPDGSVLLSRHSQPGVFTTSSHGHGWLGQDCLPFPEVRASGPSWNVSYWFRRRKKKRIWLLAFYTVKIEVIQAKRKVVSFENVYWHVIDS